MSENNLHDNEQYCNRSASFFRQYCLQLVHLQKAQGKLEAGKLENLGTLGEWKKHHFM